MQLGSGTTVVRRNGSTLYRSDYTLWSSPVAGAQTMAGFSPMTFTGKFFTYNETTNVYNTITNTSTFDSAKGYLVRMPNSNSLPGYDAGTATLSFEGNFTGTLNNGNVSVTLSRVSNGYNAVGNPYPSVINADTFITANTTNIENTLYFWRKTNAAVGTAYATYVMGVGGTASTSGGIPNGKIQVGQGFFVQAKNAVTVPNFFTNAMRDVTPTSTQFFKTKKETKDRVWLNLTSAEGLYNQTLVAYITDGTIGIDSYDGKYINDCATALTSKIDNQEYSIQSRPVFDVSDVVALNFKAEKVGSYTIELNQFDGVFASGQAVYLLDNNTGIETDLKLGSYTFTAATAGADNTRFALKYQKTLKVNEAAFNENSVRVYKNNGVLYVASGAVTISNIKIFDIQGRLLSEQKNVNLKSTPIKSVKAVNQVLIIKITGEDNTEVTKKVLN
jgi:trimeric autotransporter adhesin